MEGARVGRKGTVCVTGATGFVASWLIMRLLREGYAVRTTIRPAVPGREPRDMSFLTNLPGASENLRIFHADLSNPDSFDEAIEGCDGVFHVATPVDFEDREPEPVVTRRAIDGTLGILRASLRSKTVKRVIYTSSASALVLNNTGANMMDENFWSDPEFIRESKIVRGSYMISKTMAEKAALEFGEMHGLDIVTIVPTFVVGPFICPRLPDSVRIAMAMVFGDEDKYSYIFKMSIVNVDDLASGHIFLFENPKSAKGRYICSSDEVSLVKMSKFLSTKYPEFPSPSEEYLKGIKGYVGASLSSKKLLDSGFEFKYGFDDIYDDAIQCCREKGYL